MSPTLKPSSAVVALSGGVDSSVAAALLQGQGWEVKGLHFIVPAPGSRGHAKVQAKLAMVREVAGHLHVPVTVLDLEEEFTRRVIRPFCTAYGRGLTPNPCVRCNAVFKFQQLLRFADEKGIDCIATGHYARIRRHGTGGVSLWRGKDPRKEQSYFLHRVTIGQLSRMLFPLGELTKAETRRLAHEMGLPTSKEPESQEVCFLGGGDYREFLSREEGMELPGRGDIVDSQGQKKGEHLGSYRYTIGQRHGLGIASSRPYYVKALIPEQNLVVVGRKEEVFSSRVEVDAFHWIGEDRPQRPVQVLAQIRYRHRAAPATLEMLSEDRGRVLFEIPQWAVTPGQGLACYEGERLLGGGWIARA